MIEKQGIIKLSRYSNKSYVFVVHRGSKVIFLWEGENAAFHSFCSCGFLYTLLHNRRSMFSNFFVFHTSGSNFIESGCFSASDFFFRTVSNSFSVNCPCLMSTWLLIISSASLPAVLKCSLHFWSLPSWLVAFSFTI